MEFRRTDIKAAASRAAARRACCSALPAASPALTAVPCVTEGLAIPALALAMVRAMRPLARVAASRPLAGHDPGWRAFQQTWNVE